MSTAEPAGPLRCGRTRDYLRALVADEATEGPEAAVEHAIPADLEHLAECPYCAEELAAVRRDWAAVHQVATSAVAVPPELVGRTISTLRALRGPSTTDHVVIQQSGGTTRVKASVVVILTRALATDLLASYRHSRGGSGTARILAVRGTHEALSVDVALPYGEPVLQVADWLRGQLGALLDQHLGSAAPRVTVHVADVG